VTKVSRVTIDYQTLRNWTFEPVEQTYTARDAILYALGLNFGEPDDRGHLRYVYESCLQVFPTFAVVLGYPGPWMTNPRTGIDMLKVLHAEQRLQLHRPIPPAAPVIGRTRIVEVVDKGAGRGALVISERKVHDKASSELLCTQVSSTFCRANGGFGGPVTDGPVPHPIPEGPPDVTVEIRSSRRAALVYRLSGDYNPLHCDPDVAAAAGFREPILHGLCTYGIAARAVVDACCDGDADRLATFDVRFSAPVYPGETLRTEIWRQDGAAAFRTLVLERGTIVLNHGRALIRDCESR